MDLRTLGWAFLGAGLLLSCAVEPEVETPSPPQPKPVEPPAPQGPGPIIASSASSTWSRIGVYDRAITAGNPLKGFLTSHQWTTPDQRVPHRLEFLYLPLAQIMPSAADPAFDSVLEPFLEASAARQNHMILRFYLDYPGREPGVPDWLRETIDCNPYEDYGGGCSPDYDDPELQSILLDFIADFGRRYDGDPRLGFIQLGLLGFWGEWHTYPHGEFFASVDFQQQVIDAFDAAFNETHLLLRYPIHDSPQRRIGFHDDSFAYSTLGDVPWFFNSKLVAAGAEDRWREVPIGGEVYPELQSSLFTEDYVVDTYSQDIVRCIEETHVSWMINHGVFRLEGGYEGSQLEGAQQAALAMGYEFALPEVQITASGLHEDTVDLRFSIRLSNTGVAPFYYPLSLHLEDALGQQWQVGEDLQSLQPGTSRTFEFALDDIPVERLEQRYRLWLQSPILLGDQAIRIADTETVDGSLSFTGNFGCTVAGERVPVGTLVDRCWCDVDGTRVASDGSPCP